MPILFLHGDRDAVAPIAHVREAAAYSGWQLQEYSDATHALALTHAPLVDQQVAQFLAVQQQVSTHQLPGGESGDGATAPEEK